MTDAAASRSRSRGRELYSTGRGGAGNIHRSVSANRSPHAPDADIGSPARGREPVIDVGKVTHTGRGGAGNVRSPSREPKDLTHEAAVLQHEHDVLEAAAANTRAISTGRGGVGNIATPPRSRSRGPALEGVPEQRSLSRGRGMHSSGRGGAGNITGSDISKLDEEEDVERIERHHEPAIHSTGRGGLANHTQYSTPPPEYPVIQASHAEHQPDFVSTGRGGSGNIQSRSRSREPGANGAKPPLGHSPLGKFIDKVTGHHKEGHVGA